MITPVSEDDIARIERLAESDRRVDVSMFEFSFDGPITRVIAELRALRKVADAAVMVHGAEEREDGDTLAMAMAGLGIALRDAGRLP